MTEDEIMQELRNIREEYAAEYDNDLQAMFEDAKKSEGTGGRRVVRGKPRRITPLEPDGDARRDFA